MAHDDTPTCGKGLAANATLPARFSDLIAATAEVLERHTRALDPTDPAASAELEAYNSLVRAHRAVAADLARLADQMASYRDLPMAPHDMAVMMDPAGQTEAFQRLVALERETLALLTERVAQAEQMLG
jgi:hypothetical protein